MRKTRQILDGVNNEYYDTVEDFITLVWLKMKMRFDQNDLPPLYRLFKTLKAIINRKEHNN